MSGTALTYTSTAPSTANNVSITLDGSAYTITDSGEAIAPASAPCSDVGASVSCPAAGLTIVRVKVGGGDDTVVMDPDSVKANIQGEAGDDRLTGTSHPAPPATDDTLTGGPGNDTLDGRLGNDTLDGGTGNDTITYANRTAPVTIDLSGGGGQPGEFDNLNEVENFIGGSGDDIVVGNQVGNVLMGGQGADTLCGGLGEDTVSYANDPTGVQPDRTTGVHVDLTGRFDTVVDPTKPATARSTCDTGNPDPAQRYDCVQNDGSTGYDGAGDCVGDDVDDVVGTQFDDVLIGTAPDPCAGVAPTIEPRGPNRLSGGDGNDLLDGGPSDRHACATVPYEAALGDPDVFEGGDGNDTVTYGSRTEPVNGTIDGAADDGGLSDFDIFSLRGDAILGDVENVIGGSGGNTLEGNGEANILIGGTGNDLISGGGGGDSLIGGSGDDNLNGDEGQDSLSGADGNDSLDGGPDNDGLDGGPGNDSLVGGAGADSLAGGDGTDVVDYSARLGAVTVNPDGSADDGEAGEGDNVAPDVESANGGGDNDTLIGNGGDGVLNGGVGNDILDGGAGADTFIGGPGLDTASYAGRTAPVTVDLSGPGGDGEAGENDNVSGDVERVVGGAAGDTLIGGAGPNVLNGGSGRDTLSGGADSDQLNGGGDNDVLNGGDGDDIMNGDDGNDTLRGDAGIDTLNGETGNDSLDGGTGSDILSGGDGNDTAVYSGRTRAVRVSLGDAPNDGESKEGDFVMQGVEGARTGSGDDWIDSVDGAAGNISCGKGEDTVIADVDDDVGSDCEVVNVSASAPCSVSRRSARVTMSRTGGVRVRVTCPTGAKGTLRLVRSGKAISSRKSFSVRAGKSKTVKLKLTSKGRRAVRHRKSLRVRATLVTRATGTTGSAARKKTTRRTITVKAPTKGKRGNR